MDSESSFKPENVPPDEDARLRSDVIPPEVPDAVPNGVTDENEPETPEHRIAETLSLAYFGIIAALMTLTLLAPVAGTASVYSFLATRISHSTAIKLVSLFAGQLMGIFVAWKCLGFFQELFRLDSERLGVRFHPNFDDRLLQGLSYYLVSLPGLFFITIVMKIIEDRYGFSTDRPELQALVKGAANHPATIALFFAVVSIGAPFYEELAFRGIFFSTLRRRWTAWPTIVFSAFVFALMHDTGRILHDPRTFPLPILYLGLLLGYIRERTESVFPGMAVHALNNLMALGFALMAKQAM